MERNKKEVGNRIKMIRQSLGMTMAEFGALVDKKAPASDSIVSRWEKGTSIPSSKRLKTIAELGNTTVAYLLRPTDGEISMDIAVDVAKDIFYKKLSNKEKFRDETRQALEYFNNDSLDLILEQEISRYLKNPQVIESQKLRNLDNRSDFETYLIEGLLDRYKKEVPTNQNLIKMISDGIPKNPENYEDFDTPLVAGMPLKRALNENPQLISNDERSDLETLAEKGATLFFGEYEGAVDPKLRDEINTILEETRQKIEALKENYPDKPSKIEQDTKVFIDGNVWWKRGQEKSKDDLNLSKSTKEEIIALGSALLAKERASSTPRPPENTKEETSPLGKGSIFYPRESKY